VAVIVTAVAVVTGLVAMAKFAVAALAATVTEAGTVAALVLLLRSVTTAPAAGAAALSVTVPVLAAPPFTDTGFTEREFSGALTTSVTTLLAPSRVAVMFTPVSVVTGLVVMAKFAVVALAATVTEAGTVAALMLLLVSATIAPVAGAAALSVTVPVLPAPPVTTEGFNVIDASAEFTTSEPALLAPL
jgi:hypothetical protein